MVEGIQKTYSFAEAGAALQRIGGATERTGGALEGTWVALQRTGGALERTCGAKCRTDVALQRNSVALQRTDGTLRTTRVALQRNGGALERTGGAKDRIGGALERNGGAADRTGVALMRTGGARDRAGVALQRRAIHQTGLASNRKVQTCPPFGACRRTYCGATNEHFRLTGLCSHAPTCVRTCMRTSRWKILFTPYLVVELSSSAEIWCVYVTSIIDGTQILTFLEIHSNRDFQNSRFFCGNWIILNPELHCFLFSDRLQLLYSFPELCTHS